MAATTGTSQFKKIASVTGFFILAVTIPLASYYVTKTVFDIRNQAADDTGGTTDTGTSPSTEPREIVVCPGVGINCNFFGGDGIQEAVDSANDGDTILLSAGSYSREDYETFEFLYPGETDPRYAKVFVDLKDKAITIIGEDGATIDGENTIEIDGFAKKTSAPVTIENVAFEHLQGTDTCPDPYVEPCGRGNAIRLEEEANVTIIDCTFTDSHKFAVATNGAPTLSFQKNSVLEGGNVGIYLAGSTEAEIIGNVISQNQQMGIRIEDDSNVVIKNNIFTKNVYEAIQVYDGGTINIVNNTFAYGEAIPGSTGGINVQRTANVQIINNIIAENNGPGIVRETAGDPKHTGTLTVDYNDVWHNYDGSTEQNYAGLTAGTHDISSDPRFRSSADFHLLSDSPCIDTGDPAIEDPDESQSDMGGYGGPDACVLDPNLSGCPDCVPDCSGKECGPDGCGDTCGTCPSGETCSTSGLCVSTCTPDCTGKECGPDGCGDTCGTCSSGEICNSSGQCVAACTPNCSGRECGSDGCGGSCGTCPSGEVCNIQSQCVSSEPPTPTVTPTEPVTTPTVPTYTDTDTDTMPKTGIFDETPEIAVGCLLIGSGGYLIATTRKAKTSSNVLIRKEQ